MSIASIQVTSSFRLSQLVSNFTLNAGSICNLFKSLAQKAIYLCYACRTHNQKSQLLTQGIHENLVTQTSQGNQSIILLAGNSGNKTFWKDTFLAASGSMH